MTELPAPRLLLRQWRDADLDGWAALNADPEVREYFPTVLTRDESTESMTRFRAEIEQRGWGWWAVEVRDTGEFLGMTGLDPVDDGYPFTGVEAGWRLARSAWGHGYATEAARAALAYGFDTLQLPEVLAITAVGNVRSQAVMRRLGMTHDPAEDFDDPDVPPGPLRRSVLYRIQAQNGRTDTSPREYSMTAFDRIKAKAEELAKKAKPRAEELARKAKPKVEELREKAGPMAQSLREKAEKAGETLKSKAEDVAEGLRQGTSEANAESKPKPQTSPENKPQDGATPADEPGDSAGHQGTSG